MKGFRFASGLWLLALAALSFVAGIAAYDKPHSVKEAEDALAKMSAEELQEVDRTLFSMSEQQLTDMLRQNVKFDSSGLLSQLAENPEVEDLARHLKGTNGRLLPGVFTQINNILGNLELGLKLSIDPIPIEKPYQVILIVRLLAVVGEDGICNSFQINGDVNIAGQFLSGQEVINDVPYDRYRVELDIQDLGFTCVIELNVDITDINGIPGGFLNGDSEGSLEFSTSTAVLNQFFTVYAPSWETDTPEFYEVGDCVSDPGTITYNGDDLGNIFNLYDLTPEVVAEVESDPSYIGDPINEEFCKLAYNITVLIGDIIVDNPLTNTSGEFYVIDPFVDVGEGMPALQAEADMYAAGIPDTVDLFDLSDEDDFINGILFPGNDSDPVVNTILDFFTEGNSSDPFLQFLSDILGFQLDINGNIDQIDILRIVAGNFNESAPWDPVDGHIPLYFQALNLTGAIDIKVNLTVEEALFSAVLDEVVTVLTNFEPIGFQTVKLPRLSLGDLAFDVKLRVYAEIINNGLPDDDVLKTPFTYILDELVDIHLEWDNFFLVAAGLIALDVNSLISLQFGPLLENIFECIISTFFLTPRITGAIVNADAIRITTSGYVDALAFAAGQVLDVLLPVYQPVLPAAVEFAAQELLVNIEIIEPEECPLTDPILKNEIYNFSQGIFRELSDLADADLFTSVVGYAEFEEGGIDLLTEEFGFSIELPPFLCYSQTVSMTIQNVILEGLLPPSFNEIILLRVDPSHEYFPQNLYNVIDIGNSSNPIKIVLKFNLGTSAPKKECDTSPPPPLIMYEQDNQISLTVGFNQLRAVIELYAKYSQYAVDSIELQDMISLDCWLSRLDYPGGLTTFDIELFSLFVDFDCDCNNNLLEALADTLNSPGVWVDLQDFLNDLLDRLGEFLARDFNEERWESTINNAKVACEERGEELEPPSEFEEYTKEELGPLLQYLGFFGAAMVIPMGIGCMGRKKGVLIGKKHHEKVEEGDHVQYALYNNPLVPMYARILVPIFLALNIVMFIIGDTGDAVAIDIEGQILGVSLTFDNFITLSVISSTQKLWQAEAYLLALLLGGFSIFWPYAKLFILMNCWFVPPKYLPRKVRGKIISAMDAFGKWSFVEFHFLIFVLIVFQLQGGSPSADFLPEEKLFEVALIIKPLLSLFTFAAAVVMSLILGNICLIYQIKIDNESRKQLRKEKIFEIEQEKTKQADVHVIDNDEFKFAVTEWDFSSYHTDKHGNTFFSHRYRFTTCAVVTLCTLVGLSLICLFLAAGSPALEIDITGLVGFLVEFADQPRTYTVSVFSLAKDAMNDYAGTASIYFVAIVFLFTIAIFPMIQASMLLTMLTKSYTVPQASAQSLWHHIITAWCCVDVFVLAITLTVLELPTVAGGLVSAIEECSLVEEFMQDILYPLDLISKTDAEAACFGLGTSLKRGAYYAILAVFVLNFSNLVIGGIFHVYLHDREKILEENNREPRRHVPAHQAFLKKIGFMRLLKVQTRVIEVPKSVAYNPSASSNPMFNPDGPPPTKQVRVVVEHEKLQKVRAAKEMKLKKIDAENEYEALPHHEKLVRKLQAFFKRVDPSKVQLALPLAKEAVSRPDGMLRLNDKLMDKYGATIVLDL
mmetsp:Transcript_1213/g.1422  ORF Transcript_1213/g.1422 Transcript_1213/m.1422 type:complete len:1617 (-) Transcript_1213:51-4901(-)